MAAQAYGSFDAGAWAPATHQYGLLHLLMARSTMLEDLAAVAPARNALKALDTRLCSPALGPVQGGPAGRGSPGGGLGSPAMLLDEECDSDASYISEGEPAEPSQPVSWGRGQRGAWWKVRSSLRDDLVVRAGVSLASAELRRFAPGELLQQKGHPRVLSNGRFQGYIRMPVQPAGWVTADASRSGGAQHLIRAHTPRWRAVYQSPSSSSNGDVIVRGSVELHSEAVVSLWCGDVAEQAGPSVEYHSGILRMPIVASGRSAAASGEDAARADGVVPKVSGWVTVDATAAGGPVFFKLLAEGDAGSMGKMRRPPRTS